MLLSELSDLERWLISDVAIKELRENAKGIWWNHPTITPRTIIMQIPPTLLPESNQVRTVYQSLVHLSQTGLLRPTSQHASDDAGFIIELEGMGMFRKHLLPAKIVKNKKSYNELVDKIEGNPEIKQELKKLGDKLRDKLEDEAIDGFIKFAMRVGSDALIYYVHMSPH